MSAGANTHNAETYAAISFLDGSSFTTRAMDSYSSLYARTVFSSRTLILSSSISFDTLPMDASVGSSLSPLGTRTPQPTADAPISALSASYASSSRCDVKPRMSVLLASNSSCSISQKSASMPCLLRFVRA